MVLVVALVANSTSLLKSEAAPAFVLARVWAADLLAWLPLSRQQQHRQRLSRLLGAKSKRPLAAPTRASPPASRRSHHTQRKGAGWACSAARTGVGSLRQTMEVDRYGQRCNDWRERHPVSDCGARRLDRSLTPAA